MLGAAPQTQLSTQVRTLRITTVYTNNLFEFFIAKIQIMLKVGQPVSDNTNLHKSKFMETQNLF